MVMLWVGVALVALVGLWLVRRSRRHVEAGMAALEPAPVVLGVVLSEEPVPPLTGAVLRFRGYDWVQRGESDGKGRVTFVREAAVDGRPVLVEAQVCVADLERQSDGTMTLRGRA